MIAFKSFFLLAAANLVLGKFGSDQNRTGCLTATDAQNLTDIMVSFSTKFNATYAEPFLAADFMVQSDGANFLFGLPLGLAFNRSDFIERSIAVTANPQVPIKILNIIHGCDGVAFHWISMSKPVIRGIDMMLIKPGTYKIMSDFSEFNSAAELELLGFYPCKNCTT